jgi:membrane fusion protein (multidrug efflux system)
LQVRDKLAHDDGFGALRVRIRLPNGRMYGEVGKLDFLNNSVSGNAR